MRGNCVDDDEMKFICIWRKEIRFKKFYRLQLTDQWASLEHGFLCSSDTSSGNKSHRLGNSAGIFDTLNAISEISGLAVHHNGGSSYRGS